MTNREAIALFRSKASGSGYISDDSKYPIRRILLELKTAIAVIKRRRINKKLKLAEHDVYTLRCVEMTHADRVEYPSIPPSGLMWQKSVEPIPRFIKLIDVTSLTGTDSIPIVDWAKAKARGRSRNKAIRSKSVATFRTDGDKTYLYVLKNSWEAVSVVIVPEDFYEATVFPECGKVNQSIKCNPLDVEIGADYSTLAEASAMVIANEYRMVSSVKPDQENNDNIIT